MRTGRIIGAAVVAILMGLGSAWAGEMVDINTATVKQLEAVNGIGEKTAARIIAYREEHGRFTNVDELLHVSGIGQKRLDKAREVLTVEE